MENKEKNHCLDTRTVGAMANNRMVIEMKIALDNLTKEVKTIKDEVAALKKVANIKK